LLTLLQELISTIAIFIFIKNKSDFFFVPLINGLGALVGGIIALLAIRNKFNQTIDFSKLNIKLHLKNGFHVFLSISSSTILSASPIILIGIFVNYSMAGYYSAFEKIISAIKSLFYIINQTFFPRLSKVFAENVDSYIRIWKRLSICTNMVSIVVYAFVIIFSDYFVLFYLGKSFVQYIFIYKYISFTIISYTIINSLGLNALLVIGKTKELSISQIIPTILFVIISPFILKNYAFKVFLCSVLSVDFIIIAIRLYFLRLYHARSA